MTYDELMEAIQRSSPEDWVYGNGHWTYKNDLNIRFEDTSFTESERSEPSFHEPWAEGLGHDVPVRRVFKIYFNSSFVEEVYMVLVDGGRAHIPFPKSQHDLIISNWQYKFAKIVGKYADAHPDALEAYLDRAGIRVE